MKNTCITTQCLILLLVNRLYLLINCWISDVPWMSYCLTCIIFEVPWSGTFCTFLFLFEKWTEEISTMIWGMSNMMSSGLHFSLFLDDLVLLASLTSNEPTLRCFETVWGAFVMWFLTFKSVVKLLCHKTLDSFQSVVVGLKSTGLSICEEGGTLEAEESYWLIHLLSRLLISVD